MDLPVMVIQTNTSTPILRKSSLLSIAVIVPGARTDNFLTLLLKRFFWRLFSFFSELSVYFNNLLWNSRHFCSTLTGSGLRCGSRSPCCSGLYGLSMDFLPFFLVSSCLGLQGYCVSGSGLCVKVFHGRFKINDDLSTRALCQRSHLIWFYQIWGLYGSSAPLLMRDWG